MQENKISIFSGSLLWFGASISIAEILTGMLLAPLGFTQGMLTIILGHLIGGVLFFLAGLIGAKNNISAMESVGISFGKYGSIFFSICNILQLIGWTAVMIINSAESLDSVVSFGNIIWCIVVGILILIWILAGLKNLGKLNNIAVIILLLLSVVLGVVVFKGGIPEKTVGSISFGNALELVIAMPISWLPLIADYTKGAGKPIKLTLVSSVSYFIGSSFMYTIGLGASIFAGSNDIVKVMMTAGLGSIALLVIILATVTTTFMDVYSAGKSILNILPRLNFKIVSVALCIVGTLIAIVSPIEQYQNFLYLIGSVFIPMITILITDYFFLHKNSAHKSFDILNCVLWVFGFLLYQFFLKINTFLGSTIPIIIIVFVLCLICNKILKIYKGESSNV